MEKIKKLKNDLIEYIITHIETNGMENVDTCELGEIVDMIKDLAQTIYYCTVVEAMAEHPDKINEHLPIVE